MRDQAADERRRLDADCAIRAEKLVKVFGDLRAVDGIDLEVLRGEIFAILGPNGAGKTTFMRMLATLLTPDGGTATVMGHDLLDDPQAVRGAIAMTGQFASLDEDLTGRENLILLARLWGVPGQRGEGAGQCAAHGFRPERCGQASGEGLFGRDAPAARHRGLSDRHAGGAVPRRADDWPRTRTHNGATKAVSRRGGLLRGNSWRISRIAWRSCGSV
jgi:ABC-type dipeptide/oligopeptide/nickel transport system ATPase component